MITIKSGFIVLSEYQFYCLMLIS
ncbi:hypothetical protein JL09_g6677 [Pichia kudriavzevii]|uniref:Uncharacterized protein n=1 Tax=Pichia kudriavzevii TaxID=4909 RepID=A0A099NL91_PICKU|nr:hypothetical protein JL09_g6677 [Pichia kudriavzevii]